jgi:hypothetical protein
MRHISIQADLLSDFWGVSFNNAVTVFIILIIVYQYTAHCLEGVDKVYNANYYPFCQSQ